MSKQLTNSQHLTKTMTRKAFAGLWEIKYCCFSLVDCIKKFRKKHRIEKAVLKSVNLSRKELDVIEKEKTPVLDWDLDTLVKVMDLFGITTTQLAAIIGEEEEFIKKTYVPKNNIGKMYGVYSNRYIPGTEPVGPIRPNISEFFNLLTEKLKQKGLDELLS